MDIYYARCCGNCEHCGEKVFHYPGYGYDSRPKCNIKEGISISYNCVCENFDYKKSLKEEK